MDIFNFGSFRVPGTARGRTAVSRGEAEAHAASLGLIPGGPGWGDAIRDYILNGGRNLAEEAPPLEPRFADARIEDDPELIKPLAARNASAEFAGEDQQGVQLAQLPPETPSGRYRVSEMMGQPRHGFEEDDPKPALRGPLRPPARRISRPKGPSREAGRDALQKRYFTNPPQWNDSAPLADRIVEATRRLPTERREIYKGMKAPSSSSAIDRYYATILAREDGVTKGGGQKVNRLGMVGSSQMKPSTAPDAARFAGLPLDRGRLRNDRAYNEMLGLAYYGEMMRQFGGDPAKAAAAYNWSPGKTKAAIRAAERAGNPRDWERYVPDETRAYVEFLRKFNHMADD